MHSLKSALSKTRKKKKSQTSDMQRAQSPDQASIETDMRALNMSSICEGKTMNI